MQICTKCGWHNHARAVECSRCKAVWVKLPSGAIISKFPTTKPIGGWWGI